MRIEECLDQRAGLGGPGGIAIHRRADGGAVVEQHQLPAELLGVGRAVVSAREYGLTVTALAALALVGTLLRRPTAGATASPLAAAPAPS